MTAPFPSESVQGNIVYADQSNEIYDNYVWIARLSDEITNIDADVSLLKTAHLAYTHTKLFADLTATAPAEFKAAVRLRFEAGGMEWLTQNDMVIDLSAIRTEVLALRTYIDANQVAVKTPVTPTYSTTTSYPVDVVDTVAKPHAIATEVAKVRALFDAV